MFRAGRDVVPDALAHELCRVDMKGVDNDQEIPKRCSHQTSKTCGDQAISTTPVTLAVYESANRHYCSVFILQVDIKTLSVVSELRWQFKAPSTWGN